MKIICAHRCATNFQAETKAVCCGNGKYNLEPYTRLSKEIGDLFKTWLYGLRIFLSNIRRYNNSSQMTSFGYKDIYLQEWNPNFRVQGEVCNLISSLLHMNYEDAQFSQIYFLTPLIKWNCKQWQPKTRSHASKYSLHTTSRWKNRRPGLMHPNTLSIQQVGERIEDPVSCIQILSPYNK